MIEDRERFYALEGDIRIGGPSTWYITDWDTRRVISVTMDEDQETEDIAVGHLGPLADDIPLDVYRISLSPDGEIVSTHSEPSDDNTCCVEYPMPAETLIPEAVDTIRRDQLEELERLGPDADLVAYPPCSNEARKVVFKYYWHHQYAMRNWVEMSLWMRLPHHPNIISFDKVVIDEIRESIVGFTTVYVPNGNLLQNKTRVFKLKWLEQLINVVDLLNLYHGIAHQDIAPRNLLIDETTDMIKLFDFNFAARIRPKVPRRPRQGEKYSENRNDVKGVVFTMYEIITQDTTLRDIPHERQDIDAIPADWIQHPEVQLDHPVETFREILRHWQEERKNIDPSSHHFAEPIEWPDRPKPSSPSPETTSCEGPLVVSVEDIQMMLSPDEIKLERRQNLLAQGKPILNWERPPQRVLDRGTRLLSTGAVLNC